ncbi:helix-turn-helix transcriptional regulator [Pseudarthrobacter enclensis]|uniref:helix-turn-helix domain-containing protein n=1 Tax=Pseudarthrobacter enclensis TaxID=993070 RepID=UPI00342E254C
MATERVDGDPRIAAQAAILRSWGKEWRRVNGKSQQDLGRAAGYGSDESPKSAAVAISRIESGKTDPSGKHRQRLLDVLGRTEAELDAETERALSAPSQRNPVVRALAGTVYIENDTRRTRIISASNLLDDRIRHQLQDSEQTLERARNNFVLPFLETAGSVDWQPLLDVQHVGSVDKKSESYEVEIRALREQTQVSILRTLTESAAGAVAGVGVGAGTAAGVFAAVSALATASTGTTIASLSGAAASSATLAWLGGGSLAAGGMGVAGGTAVLTGVVALPMLLALGAVLVWKGRRLRREAEAEAEKLDAAQQALEDVQAALPRAEKWNNTQQAIIQRAELLGRTVLSRYLNPIVFDGDSAAGEERRVEWDKLSPKAQKALDIELKLLSIILDIQALPVWLGVTTVNEPELNAVQKKSASVSEEWIEESLVLAQFELDEHEEWVRGLMAEDSLK